VQTTRIFEAFWKKVQKKNKGLYIYEEITCKPEDLKRLSHLSFTEGYSAGCFDGTTAFLKKVGEIKRQGTK